LLIYYINTLSKVFYCFFDKIVVSLSVIKNYKMIFLGDTHGNNSYIKYIIKQKKITNQHIIHVGDFGVGFIGYNQEIQNLGHFNKWLKLKDITLHVFRGNHDDPKFFTGDHIYGNLKLHVDYTVLEIEDKKILGIGGAVSIDRSTRWKEQNSWWPDEVFVLDEDKLNEVSGIDILVTHTTPSEIPPDNSNGFPPIVLQFAHSDGNLIEDLDLERELLSKALKILLNNDSNNITHHFYGHFHQDIKTELNGCEHICLGIGKFHGLIDYTDYENEMNEKYSK